MTIQHIPENYRDLGIVLDDPASVIGRRFPDYLVVGPWRTGTTWLAKVLHEHAQIFMTEPKEPLYFSHLNKNAKQKVPKEFSWYLDLFSQNGSGHDEIQLFGEASATYAYELPVETIRFIYAVNPQIKIIFGLRHPVERAWSHIKMNIQTEPEVFGGLQEDEQYRKALSRKYIIQSGMYTQQIGKWRSVIPQDQLFVFSFDKLERDPVKAFAEVCTFLGVAMKPELSSHINQFGKVGSAGDLAMPPFIHDELYSVYKEEITQLTIHYDLAVKESSVRNMLPPVILVGDDDRKYSETFIDAHVDRLQGQRVALDSFHPLRASGRNGFVIANLIKQWRASLNVARLRRELKNAQGSVLIEYGTTAARALPALRRLNKKIVVHFHGYDAHRHLVVSRYKDAYRELFACVDAIVVVSSTMKQTIKDLGAEESKLYHIVYGVDITKFREADVAANPPVFFACGRFVEKKAPHLTIQAFGKAHQQMPGIRLRMAGDGPLLNTCRALIKELRLEHCVQLLGAIGHEAVAKEMMACRAFVQHSVTAADGDSEGTPVGILEAGCSAVPVIASRHAGIPDVVIEGETGLLFAEFDVDAMAAAILRLAQDAHEAQRIGKEAAKHIRERYSMDKSIAKLAMLLN